MALSPYWEPDEHGMPKPDKGKGGVNAEREIERIQRRHADFAGWTKLSTDDGLAVIRMGMMCRRSRLTEEELSRALAEAMYERDRLEEPTHE